MNKFIYIINKKGNIGVLFATVHMDIFIKYLKSLSDEDREDVNLQIWKNGKEVCFIYFENNEIMHTCNTNASREILGKFTSEYKRR